MIKKKVCMLGAFAVGKTSMVRQFVSSIFSEKYLTTVGVKIDKKSIILHNQPVDLILWDLHGEDEFQAVRMSYLRGSAGCIYVVDGTRKASVEVALRLKDKVEKEIGEVPFILALNKSDLKNEWEINPDEIKQLVDNKAVIIETSAKTGQFVEDAFMRLAALMVES
jgi:small GTP-binding protein